MHDKLQHGLQPGGLSVKTGKLRATAGANKPAAVRWLVLVFFLGLHQTALLCNGACLAIPQWTQIGPGPLFIKSADGTEGKGPDAGMVRDIAIDPSGTSDQIIYLGTDSGGVWKTTDAGATWLPLTDSLPSPNIGAVALDPGNPSIVYAGSGNARNNFVSSIGAGIYKSLDGGQSWTVLGAPVFTNLAINRIVVPLPGLVLVASSSGLYRSIDGGAHFGSNSPAFDDGNSVLGGFVTDLDVDTSISTSVYASIPGAGIFKSTDAGATFPASGNLFSGNNGSPLGAAYIAFAQSTRPDNQTMYVHAGFAPDAQGNTAAGLYKSIDGGANWTTIALNTGTDSAAVQLGYGQTVGVDPQDANRVFIGERGLYEATDGGASGVTSANRIDLNQVHSDQHALVFSPASHWTAPAPTRVYNGCDGGIATTANAGPNATWTILNGTPACVYGNGALATLLFRQIDIGRGSPANNAYTYGAAQDLGVSSHQPNCPGTPWLYGGGGDGTSVAVDPANPRHAIAFSNEQMLQTTDGGLSFQVNNAVAVPGSGVLGLVYFDPNGGFAYANSGANGTLLYQSRDNGNTFALVHTFPSFITAISIPAADSNTIWVGLGDGTVQRTSNGRAGTVSAWPPLAKPSTTSGPVTGVAADPSNSALAVVAYGAGQNNVFRTTDSGASWTMIAGDLPAVRLNAVAIDPNATTHAILVATDTGVMRTRDYAHWETLGTGLPIVHCTSLALDAAAVPSLLRVGTYGRSSFELAYDRGYVNWQNGGFQDGTLQNPFQTILQALNAPSSGAVRFVNIQTGSYAEGPITYNQCATLNALNGAVTIH